MDQLKQLFQNTLLVAYPLFQNVKITNVSSTNGKGYVH